MRILIVGRSEAEAAHCAHFLDADRLDWRWAPNRHDHRERALNEALQREREEGRTGDILIVGDDIRGRPHTDCPEWPPSKYDSPGTPGWYAALMAHYDDADIIGLSTVDPLTGRLRDAGFDLVDRGHGPTLEPHLMGEASYTLTPFRYCDAICGCFMLIKQSVLDVVTRFETREEFGGGRWGEAIYSLWARREGFRTGVVGHVVGHYGTSTKGGRSISALEERGIWDRVVRSGILTHMTPRSEPVDEVAPVLREWLQRPRKRTALWGCGTVAERLLKASSDEHELVLCSGLSDEWGKDWFNHIIQAPDEVEWGDVDRLLVTPRMDAETIAETIGAVAGVPEPEVVRRDGGVLDV